MSFSQIASSLNNAVQSFKRVAKTLNNPEQQAKKQVIIPKSEEHKTTAMQRTQAKQAQKKSVQPKTTTATPAQSKAKPAMQRMSERRKGKLNGVNWKKRHGNS